MYVLRKCDDHVILCLLLMEFFVSIYIGTWLPRLCCLSVMTVCNDDDDDYYDYDDDDYDYDDDDSDESDKRKSFSCISIT